MGQRITGAKVKGECRRFLAVLGGSVVLVLVAMGGLAAPAEADLLGGTLNTLGALTGVPGTPASSLDAAFRESPANLAAALACPVVKAVAGVTSGVPVVGTVVDQLPAVVCALNILGYAYRTTYVRPDGTKVVRIFHALAGVPTLLDVTGDGVPDFTGTLSVSLTLNGISLNITRLLLAASTPVTVEAVALDPATPQTYVGVGEDGAASGTGGSWTTSLNVFGIGGGSVDLGLGMSTSLGRPPTLGLLGEVLSGNTADAPTTTSRGDVLFTPVPSALTTEIKVSQGRQEAIVTSPTPSTVNAHVNLITASDEKDIDATIDQLPSSVDIVHQTQATHETTTYTANAPINQVDVDYHDHMGSAIPTAAHFTAKQVPTALTLDQAGQTTSLTTGGGPVGSIFASVAELAVGAATGSMPPTPVLPSTPDFAAYRESVAGFTAEAQFSGLVSAVYTASPVSATVSANTANEALLTYQKDFAGGPAKASIDVNRIPSQVAVAMDPTGRVTYAASSDISSIVATASEPSAVPDGPGQLAAAPERRSHDHGCAAGALGRDGGQRRAGVRGGDGGRWAGERSAGWGSGVDRCDCVVGGCAGADDSRDAGLCGLPSGREWLRRGWAVQRPGEDRRAADAVERDGDDERGERGALDLREGHVRRGGEGVARCQQDPVAGDGGDGSDGQGDLWGEQ